MSDEWGGIEVDEFGGVSVGDRFSDEGPFGLYGERAAIPILPPVDQQSEFIPPLDESGNPKPFDMSLDTIRKSPAFNLMNQVTGLVQTPFEVAKMNATAVEPEGYRPPLNLERRGIVSQLEKLRSESPELERRAAEAEIIPSFSKPEETDTLKAIRARNISRMGNWSPSAYTPVPGEFQEPTVPLPKLPSVEERPVSRVEDLINKIVPAMYPIRKAIGDEGATAFLRGVVNSAISLPEFTTSQLGATSVLAGANPVTRPLVTTGFLADTLKGLTEQAKNAYANWGSMTDAQKGEALSTIAAQTGFAALLGKGVVSEFKPLVQSAPKVGRGTGAAALHAEPQIPKREIMLSREEATSGGNEKILQIASKYGLTRNEAIELMSSNRERLGTGPKTPARLDGEGNVISSEAPKVREQYGQVEAEGPKGKVSPVESRSKIDAFIKDLEQDPAATGSMPDVVPVDPVKQANLATWREVRQAMDNPVAIKEQGMMDSIATEFPDSTIVVVEGKSLPGDTRATIGPNGETIINKSAVDPYLESHDPKLRKDLLRSIVREEWIHSFDKPDMGPYWKGLSSIERAIFNKSYTGEWGGKPKKRPQGFTESQMGSEAYRRHVQNMLGMKPTEILEAKGLSWLNEQFLDLAQRSIFKARQALGRDAATFQVKLLDEFQARVDAGRQRLGLPPVEQAASFDKEKPPGMSNALWARLQRVKAPETMTLKAAEKPTAPTVRPPSDIEARIAALEQRQTQAAAEPVREALSTTGEIEKLTPNEFTQYVKSQPGGTTGAADAFGAKMATPEGVAKLTALKEKYSAAFKEKMAVKDRDNAGFDSERVHFYEEAANKATEKMSKAAPESFSKEPRKESDYEDWKKTQSDMVKFATEGNDAELYKAFARNEVLKNKYGGMPPPKPTTEPLRMEPKIDTVEEVVFTTSKGSKYVVFPDGTTQRNKAPRPEHPGEHGLQPRSTKTWYVTPDQAAVLSEVQTKGASRSTIGELPDGRIGVRYLDGKDVGKFERRTIISPKQTAEPGLIPIEYFGDKKTVHFGNPVELATEPLRMEPKPESFEKSRSEDEPPRTGAPVAISSPDIEVARKNLDFHTINNINTPQWTFMFGRMGEAAKNAIERIFTGEFKMRESIGKDVRVYVEDLMSGLPRNMKKQGGKAFFDVVNGKTMEQIQAEWGNRPGGEKIIAQAEKVKGRLEEIRVTIRDTKKDSYQNSLSGMDSNTLSSLYTENIGRDPAGLTRTQMASELAGLEYPADWGISDGTYLPHLFFGGYKITASIPGQEGSLFVTRANTPAEAKAKIYELTRNNPQLANASFKVDQDTVIPADMIRLGDKKFWSMVAKMKENLGVSTSEIKDAQKGIIGRKAAKQKWFGSLQQRLGYEGYSKDFNRVMSSYLSGFHRWKELSAMQREVQPMIEKVRSEGRGQAASALEDIMDALWGKPAKSTIEFDNLMQHIPGIRDLVKPLALDRWSRNVRSLVGLATLRTVRFATINRLQPLQGLYPIVGERLLVKGKIMQHTKEGRALLDEAGVTYDVSQYGQEGSFLTKAKRLGEKFSGERSNQELAFLSMFLHGTEQGMARPEAIRYAKLRGQLMTQFTPLVSDVPPAFRGPIGQVVFQFKRFPVKQVELAANLVRDRNVPGIVRMLAGFTVLGGAAFFMRQTYQDAEKKARLRRSFKQELGDKGADIAMYGLPGLLGADISGSLVLGDEPMGANIYEKVGRTTMGPAPSLVYETGKGIATAARQPITAAEKTKAILRKIPSLRPLSELSDLITKNVDVLTPDGEAKYRRKISDVIAGVGSFRGANEANKQLAVNAIMELKKEDNKLKNALYVAMRVGKTTNPQWEEIRKFNKRWPEAAITTEEIQSYIDYREKKAGKTDEERIAGEKFAPLLQR